MSDAEETPSTMGESTMEERLKERLEDDDVEVWVVNEDGESIEEDLSSESPPDVESPDVSPQESSQLRTELEEMRNQRMRTLADFDNFRKRAEREKGDIKRYALIEPLRELLPVIDNLERALQADGSVEDLKLGVEMTLTQLREMMRRRGLQQVPAAGHPFDPAVHDAVSRFEDETVSQPTVADELQSGYLLHDRLLRPAMVRVAMPPEANGADDAGDGQE